MAETRMIVDSVETLEDAISKFRVAQQKFPDFSQDQVDKI